MNVNADHRNIPSMLTRFVVYGHIPEQCTIAPARMVPSGQVSMHSTQRAVGQIDRNVEDAVYHAGCIKCLWKWTEQPA